MWATPVEEGSEACDEASPKILKLLEDFPQTWTRLARTILTSSTSPPKIILTIVVLAFYQKGTPICDLSGKVTIIVICL